MDVRIAIETTFDNGEKRTHQLDGISRPYRVTCPESAASPPASHGNRFIPPMLSHGQSGDALIRRTSN